MSPFMILACGQSCIAIRIGIAERTPKYRASYEHEATTPLSPPPTMSGIPSNCGFSSLAQETKKVSKSMWTMERCIFKNCGVKIYTKLG